MAVHTLMTRAEFKRLPEGPPYYEYEHGEVIEVPRPHPWHNRVVHRLGTFLDDVCAERDAGEVFTESEVDLTQDLVYAPDIVFVRKERLGTAYDPILGEITGAPDLVVEVASPSHPDRDRIRKFSQYERVGVEWLWLVDALTLSIEEYHLEGGRYARTASVLQGEVFRPGVLPGLEIDLLQVAGEPPRLLPLAGD